MSPMITWKRLDKTGDREDFSVRVIGPGETDYTFRLSITGTIDAIWGSSSQEAAEALSAALVYSHGTAREYPDAYWFDSYNSGDTIKATVDLIYSEGERPFLHPSVRGKYAGFVGDETLAKLEAIDQAYIDRFGYCFLRSLDDAFEYAEAANDLSVPPKDNANFLYRVCVLSVIIDHFNVAITGGGQEGSLNKFDEWQQTITEGALSVSVETFRMLKRLRKQYPIHEHYKLNAEGVRTLKNEVVTATSYFELRQGEPEHNWHQVVGKFNVALDAVYERIVGDGNAGE